MAPDDPAKARIRVRANEPYGVEGGVALTRTAQVETEFGDPIAWISDEPVADGDETYELCRCGGSSTEPFCDGWRRNAVFRDG